MEILGRVGDNTPHHAPVDKPSPKGRHSITGASTCGERLNWLEFERVSPCIQIRLTVSFTTQCLACESGTSIKRKGKGNGEGANQLVVFGTTPA